jgi:polyhydroxyalkanoate synthesis regulator phasin
MIIAFAVTLFLIPGISGAQMQGGGKGQGMISKETHGAEQGTGMMSPGMYANMTKMAEMMNKMSQMMSTGKMTADQQKQCAEIMKQMSQMMHEMPATQKQQTTEMQHKHLQGMEKELDPLFYAIHP